MERTLGIVFALWFCLLCKTNLVSLGCRDEERQVLLSFKQSLNDTHHVLSDWKDGDCCGWAGVGCSNKTGHVIKLSIGRLISNGEFIYDCPISSSHLDHSLSALKHLRYLDLSFICFNHTSIPQFIGSFSSLRYLNLSYCDFAETIPPHLGNLTNLQYLDLSSSYNLRADSLQLLSHLSSLQYLDLSNMNLADAVDWPLVFYALPALSALKLSFCELQIFPVASPAPKANLSSIATLDLAGNFFPRGTEFDWLLNLSSSLVHLDLSACNIYGPIPHFLGNLSSLKSLHIFGNRLNGSVPGSLSQLSQLEILDLSDNYLQGPIQGTLGNLCNLQTLDLSYNQIVGDISGMGAAPTGCLKYSLEELDLSSNQLSGSLPDWIGQMRKLKYLILGSNSLNGSVPVSLGQLSELVVLDLNYNSLQGVVSDALFPNMTELEELSLSSNRLVFNIRSTWVPPFQLKFIELGSCRLGPQFPSWLRTQREFSYIDISGAGISGVVPDWFWNVSSQVYYLNISYNQIRGEVPASMKFLSAAIIDLSSNQFQGQLPYLNSRVERLFLYDNLFSGNLEPILNEAMSNLETIVLSRNLLTGNIPTSICKLEDMAILNLSYNNLSGEIPKCRAKSYGWSVINLASNDLCGEIPQWIGYLPQLLLLQLSNNSFQGEIPSLRNCTNMIMLDLGENNLIGNIPTWIGENLSSLKFLRLRSNKFNGTIPPQLSYLTSLQVLDLAHNDLSGNIPSSFLNFTAMSQPNKTEVGNHSPNGYGFSLGIASIRGQLDITENFEETLVVVTKGRELDYTNTAYLVMLLDLSCNSLSGEVPIELMNLVGLQSLNLSGNQLTGMIPDMIGGMVCLESLDLSRNQLLGSIPQSITSLTALSHLNLSYNNLSGRIPSGNQLQTLTDPSIYYGNRNLCGFPLPNACLGDGSSEVPITVGSENGDDESDMFGLYLSIGLGFVVGLWGVYGVFIFKNSWMIAYFQFCDDMANKISVAKEYLKKGMVCDSRLRWGTPRS